VKAAALEEDRADWFADARLMILRLSITEPEFTADDLRKVLRPPASDKWPGLAFSRAQDAGLIEWVAYVKSKTKSRKGSPVSVWRRKTQGVTP